MDDREKKATMESLTKGMICTSKHGRNTELVIAKDNHDDCICVDDAWKMLRRYPDDM